MPGTFSSMLLGRQAHWCIKRWENFGAARALSIWASQRHACLSVESGYRGVGSHQSAGRSIQTTNHTKHQKQTKGALSVSAGVCTNAGSLHTACGLPHWRIEFVPDVISMMVNINISSLKSLCPRR